MQHIAPLNPLLVAGFKDHPHYIPIASLLQTQYKPINGGLVKHDSVLAGFISMHDSIDLPTLNRGPENGRHFWEAVVGGEIGRNEQGGWVSTEKQ